MARLLGVTLFTLLATAFASCSGIRTVVPGVIRTPQLHEDLMARVAEQHAVRTIVCLRGSGRSSRPSARAAVGIHAAFINIPMSATRLPDPQTLLALWDVAATAERPLLMHCRAGVDRTGLAAAILVLHDTGDLDLARDQLALIPNGHVAFTATGAMDRVLELFEMRTDGSMTFPDWVRQEYPGQRAAELRSAG